MNFEKNKSCFWEALKVNSCGLRYGVVLNIAKLLTPVFYKTVLLPRFTKCRAVMYPNPYDSCRPMNKCIQKLHLSFALVGAEIGVYAGVNAFSILHNLRLKRLYLVDPYVPYYMDGVLTYPKHALVIAQANLKRFSNVKWIREMSVNAASKIDEQLDFAYIDGNHSYVAVKQDLQAFYPLIRKGGFLGGHDFTTEFLGVTKAVSEFAVANQLDLFVEQPDWWVIKK
jgi:hypothetical protein